SGDVREARCGRAVRASARETPRWSEIRSGPRERRELSWWPWDFLSFECSAIVKGHHGRRYRGIRAENDGGGTSRPFSPRRGENRPASFAPPCRGGRST